MPAFSTRPNDPGWEGDVQCGYVRAGRRCQKESSRASLFCERHLNSSSSRASQRHLRYGAVMTATDLAESWKRNYDDPELLNGRGEVVVAQTVLEKTIASTDFDNAKERSAVIAQVDEVSKIMSRVLALEIERGAVLTLAQGKTLALGIGDDINRLILDPQQRRALMEAIGARFAMLIPSNYEEQSYRKELEVATAAPYYVDLNPEPDA